MEIIPEKQTAGGCMVQRLKVDFYQRNTVIVARDLIGKKLVRYLNGSLIAGIITETEAYGHDEDLASHAYRGKTQRNSAMFGPIGHAYIYFIYGNHFCFNVVARSEDQKAGAVLIRSIIPTDGIEHMFNHRNRITQKDLTNGPGKLAQALRITKELNAISLQDNEELFLVENEIISPMAVQTTERIGLSRGKDLLWRFVAN